MKRSEHATPPTTKLHIILYYIIPLNLQCASLRFASALAGFAADEGGGQGLVGNSE